MPLPSPACRPPFTITLSFFLASALRREAQVRLFTQLAGWEGSIEVGGRLWIEDDAAANITHSIHVPLDGRVLIISEAGDQIVVGRLVNKWWLAIEAEIGAKVEGSWPGLRLASNPLAVILCHFFFFLFFRPILRTSRYGIYTHTHAQPRGRLHHCRWHWVEHRPGGGDAGHSQGHRCLDAGERVPGKRAGPGRRHL